jgi:hypothetical protein
MIRLTTLATVLLSAAALRAQVSVLTWHNDSARTGQNLQETLLTPANVNSATFGRLATLIVDGKVDAQPLYVPGLTIASQGVHNVLYVATEHGSLYAFDADTFQQLLKVSLLGVNETTASVSCSQVTPEIGITGTPAIDLQAGPNGVIFALAQSQDVSHTFHHRLHALDLPTLTERPGSPVNITATYPGSGAENTFNPNEHVARPALLISNGVVYTSWGSHCDSGSYAGWILSYSETTLAQVGVLNVIPNGNRGGIWSAGSGPAADANGNIYALIGNGTFDTTLNGSGFPALGDYGNSMVKVSTSGALSVVDYFTMSNTVAESSIDTDFGSAGLMLLPPLDNREGTGMKVSLAVGAGKDHNIYVLNQANLGKFNSDTNSIYQQLTDVLPGGTWSSPAWFNGSIYYAGSTDYLRQFTFASGEFSLAATSSAQFVFPGGTPSISANGAANGIVWVTQNLNPAVLHAYDAAHFPNELYNSNQAADNRDNFGAGNKYMVPTIVNGRVYVGTTTGVGVFGLTMFTLTTSVSPSGGGTVTPASGSSYASGTVVNVQATPNAGYSLANWTSSPDLVANSVANTTTITMNAAETLTANFAVTPASPPALVSPANRTAGVSLTPAVTWNVSAGATSYNVYFGTSLTPPFVTTVSTTSYNPGALVIDTTYYWQIVARNASGIGVSALWSFTTQSVAAGPVTAILDFNGDGKQDVFLYDPVAGTGYAGLSNGSGEFTYVYNGFTPGFDTIRYGAFSNSGFSGLVAYDSTAPLGYALLGSGTGTFSSAVSMFWGPGFTNVAAGDLNGDGLTDLVIYRPTDGTSYTAISNGNGTFRYQYTLASIGFTHMVVADFNGDGKADVFFYRSTDGLAYLGISNGTGGFTFSPVTLGPGYGFVESGDINGDGMADLLLYSGNSGAAAVGLSTGSGFRFTPYSYSAGFTTVKLFDFNGDGKADVALYNMNNTLGYLGVGNGTGAFTFSSLFWGVGMSVVDALDLNGDGKIDVVIYNTTNGASYTGISTGNAANPFTYQYSYWGNGKVLATMAAQP